MWRTFFKRFGARVVMTIYFDGEVNFSFAKMTPLGLITNKIYGKMLLLEDGTTSCDYVESWVEI